MAKRPVPKYDFKAFGAAIKAARTGRKESRKKVSDGNGSWNSRSVKYILTNRTYTGMLVQGKEKRAVEATHEPLVDSETFDAI